MAGDKTLIIFEHRLSTVHRHDHLVFRDNGRVAGAGIFDRLALAGDDGRVYALLDIAEVYPLEFDAIVPQWFGTASSEYPGVRRILGAGGHCLAGDVTLVERRPSPHRHFELTPAQARLIFTHKGWSRVVSFHTRNACHRVHEHIQPAALEWTRADGLYISPVIGPKKPGDFLPGPIMRSYQALLENGVYPKGKADLGSFATYSRYAGPREAVFTALCRKSMGCSHFIVGRDHTGVGDFYGADANRKLFEIPPDLGVTPVFFDAVAYNPKLRRYAENGGDDGHLAISGTQAREHLRRGERLPDWYMRDLVRDTLLNEIAAERPLFYDDLAPGK